MVVVDRIGLCTVLTIFCASSGWRNLVIWSLNGLWEGAIHPYARQNRKSDHRNPETRRREVALHLHFTLVTTSLCAISTASKAVSIFIPDDSSMPARETVLFLYALYRHITLSIFLYTST
jgi:hypothetical protein